MSLGDLRRGVLQLWCLVCARRDAGPRRGRKVYSLQALEVVWARNYVQHQRNQQGMALNLVGMPQPVYHFELRRLTAEALNRDAANLKIKEFTGDKYGHLEQLRKPPEQPKRGGLPAPKK